MTHVFLTYISVTQYPGKTNTFSLCRKIKFTFRVSVVKNFSSQRRSIRSFCSFWFLPTNLCSRFTYIISCPRMMPPIYRGRRSRVQNMNAVADAAELTDDSVQQLRNFYRQRNVVSTGNKTTVHSGLFPRIYV